MQYNDNDKYNDKCRRYVSVNTSIVITLKKHYYREERVTQNACHTKIHTQVVRSRSCPCISMLLAGASTLGFFGTPCTDRFEHVQCGNIL